MGRKIRSIDIYTCHISKLIVATILVLSISMAVPAEVIPVCTEGCGFASIQEAIDAAVPGDVIEVQSGTYSENVNITKQLTLKGVDTGAGKPVVDAGCKGSAITLYADGIVLEGIRMENSYSDGIVSWAGIKVISNNNTIIGNTVKLNQNGIEVASNNNTIIDNIVESNGIVLTSSSSNTISGNTVTYSEYGIRLISSSDNFVADNNLSGNIYGLLLNSSDDNIVKGNKANDNDYGILLDSSVGNNLTDNLMYENIYNFGADGDNDIDISNIVNDGKRIYYIVGSSGEIIKSDAGAVYCINCDNMSINGLVLSNGIYGIYFYNTTNSTVENNSLFKNGCGIGLVESSNNTIRSNDISSNEDGTGIRLQNCIGNDVYTNEISQNKYGIYYDEYSYIKNNLDNNQMSGNYEDHHLSAGVAKPPGARPKKKSK